jgi:hypothetical protein
VPAKRVETGLGAKRLGNLDGAVTLSSVRGRFASSFMAIMAMDSVFGIV